MGKGLAFLNLKFFHPSNNENQRRKWEALQKERLEKQKLRERKIELEQEKELHDTRLMLIRSANNGSLESEEYKKEVLKEQIAWMYILPPGLKKSLESERAKMTEEKRKKEWQSLMSGMTREERRLAEKEMEQGLSVHERNVRRFDFLKNAPMTAEYVKSMEVTHKPFGKLMRNVRCMKCGNWGHKIYDRECEMNAYNPFTGMNHSQNVIADEKKEKLEKSSKTMNDSFMIRREDPLRKMKAKYLERHLKRYNSDSERYSNSDNSETDSQTNHTSENRNHRTSDLQSVYTLNADKNDKNAKQFVLKNNEPNDGTHMQLLFADEEENVLDMNANANKKSKKRKKNKKKNVRKLCDMYDSSDEDYRYIQSLSEKQRRKMLDEILEREQKRKLRKRRKKKHKKLKKRKHRKERRLYSRSRSRSRSYH